MSAWIAKAMPHLVVAPILVPLVAAALIVVLGEARRGSRALVGVIASVVTLAVAIALLLAVDRADGTGAVAVYLPANWPVPFGIALAVDRLSALMLVLTGGLALAASLSSTARWHRAGVHFHPLFQLQVMGLNGAFLTADLFNLFVFFEVMLAASYGLLLHGSGTARVRSAVHYVAINLAASSAFLIGVAVLYGVTGTLSLADMAQKVAGVPAADRGLLHAGVAILSIAFLVKAAAWPLGAWLVPAYDAAAAPVAALFAIMTKVGVYAVLRVWTLLFPAGAGSEALYGADALVGVGLVTLALGTTAVLASQRLGRVAAASIVVSAGTLIAALGFALPALTGGALFYLVTSTIAAGAIFLVVDLVERPGDPEAEAHEHDAGAGRLPFALDTLELPRGVNLDDDERALVGRVFPASVVFLGLGFMACALLLAGLPPLPGFLAKVTMLSALLTPSGPAAAIPDVTPAGWLLVALVIGSGLVATLALARAGIRLFWKRPTDGDPPLRVVEGVPIAALVLAGLALTVFAEPVARYTGAAASAVHRPTAYVDAIIGARTVQGPTRPLETADAKEAR